MASGTRRFRLSSVSCCELLVQAEVGRQVQQVDDVHRTIAVEVGVGSYAASPTFVPRHTPGLAGRPCPRGRRCLYRHRARRSTRPDPRASGRDSIRSCRCSCRRHCRRSAARGRGRRRAVPPRGARQTRQILDVLLTAAHLLHADAGDPRVVRRCIPGWTGRRRRRTARRGGPAGFVAVPVRQGAVDTPSTRPAGSASVVGDSLPVGSGPPP